MPSIWTFIFKANLPVLNSHVIISDSKFTLKYIHKNQASLFTAQKGHYLISSLSPWVWRAAILSFFLAELDRHVAHSHFPSMHPHNLRYTAFCLHSLAPDISFSFPSLFPTYYILLSAKSHPYAAPQTPHISLQSLSLPLATHISLNPLNLLLLPAFLCTLSVCLMRLTTSDRPTLPPNIVGLMIKLGELASSHVLKCFPESGPYLSA